MCYYDYFTNLYIPLLLNLLLLLLLLLIIIIIIIIIKLRNFEIGFAFCLLAARFFETMFSLALVQLTGSVSTDGGYEPAVAC